MIIAFCGLSGTGKSTIAREISKLLNIPFVITYTTRPIRPGEKNGVDYHFINSCTWSTMNLCNNIVAPQEFNVVNGQVWKYGINKHDLTDNNNIIMVLTPSGVSDLRSLGYEVISVCIEVDEDIRLKRIYNRNDNQGKNEIKRRTDKDKLAFKNFTPDYIIKNNMCLNDAIEQFIKLLIIT